MSQPTNRILALLELLQAHGQLSGAEIARRLGVDRRTVRRYIAALEELGIPVTAERGAGGGYSLVAGFKLPPMLFTDDEALALSLGLLAASALGLGQTAAGLTSARAKLERVMPADLKRRLRAADETMQLDLPASGPPAEGNVLAALSAAAQAQRTVHVGYEAADKRRTARDLDPYGLAYRGGCWYVVGFCHLRQGPRTFRVDRIASVARTSRSFARPETSTPWPRSRPPSPPSPEPTAPRSSSTPTSPPRSDRSSPPWGHSRRSTAASSSTPKPMT